MNHARKSKRQSRSTSDDVADNRRVRCKSITLSGSEVAEPHCKSWANRAHHCRSRARQRASSSWRLLVTTSCIGLPIRCPVVAFSFLLQHWHCGSVSQREQSYVLEGSIARTRNVTVQGSGGRRLYLPPCTTGRSFLELNEAEQYSFSRHRFSCAASQSRNQ